MRKYTESDIFIKMNNGNAIYNQLASAVKAINGNSILNDKLQASLDGLTKAYKETLVLKIIDAIKAGEIIIIAQPIDKRFPANMPFVKSKRQGKDCVIVDISKYAVITRGSNDEIVEASCDIPKLYNLLVPAYINLKVLNNDTIISTETTKWLAYLWAKLFNKILKAQKLFVGTSERYEAFMYFAMRFFMIYYLNTSVPIVDKISNEFIKNAKSKYIVMIENNLKQKNIDIYRDWGTFAYTMFSNEITNIRGGTSVEMNAEHYLRLFSNYMGRDGAYLALWSAEYFFYCLFVTYNHAWILNDRNWADIVDENPKIMPRILSGLYKEI